MDMISGKILIAGKAVAEAEKALIMLHGRGGSAEDILSLSKYLQIEGCTFLAPQASGGSWYPYSFLAPKKNNEPWLTSSIDLLGSIKKDLNDQGITTDRIYLLGFSQGACLALEYAARFAEKYGGIAAFTGGLIGDIIYPERYNGDFMATPVFIGTSDPDPHVPLARVEATAEVYRKMNAELTLKIYKNMGHTISDDEINTVNGLIFS
ncbi:MAG: alpha/beta hydrolase [Bacillota bacterium]